MKCFRVQILQRYDLAPDGIICIKVIETLAKSTAAAIRNARYRVFGRGYLGRSYMYQATEVR